MPTPSIKETISAHDEGEDLPRMGVASIEAAAKAISACMDYPWEHMPEQGRNTMRRNAKTVLAAALSAAPQSDGWILPSDSLPEPDVDVLVWSQHFWEKAPSAKIDQWSMQREAPLEFSSATIEVGFGWNEHDDFESVIAWKAINPPAPTQGQSHGE